MDSRQMALLSLWVSVALVATELQWLTLTAERYSQLLSSEAWAILRLLPNADC